MDKAIARWRDYYNIGYNEIKINTSPVRKHIIRCGLLFDWRSRSQSSQYTHFVVVVVFFKFKILSHRNDPDPFNILINVQTDNNNICADGI